jgi:hypothetical protein
MLGSAYTSGFGNDVTSTFAFVGPTLTVTAAPGQTISVVASKAFGSTVAGGGTGLSLWVCYQSTAAGSPLTQIGGGMFNLAIPAGAREVFTLPATVTPPAGTYLVGMCGSSPTPDTWNSNEFGYITATLFTTSGPAGLVRPTLNVPPRAR